MATPATTPELHPDEVEDQSAAPAAHPASSVPGGEITPTVVQPAHQDYSLDEIPQFERDTLPMDQVKVTQGTPYAMTGIGAEHRHATAYVSPKNPLAIEVLDPHTFKQPQLDHEMTHAYEDTTGAKFAPVNPADLYGYGGADGLMRDAQAGKKVTDYSNEQLARIVENHTQYTRDLMAKAKDGSLTQEDVDEYRKWQGAVAPVIHGLAGLAGNKRQYQAQPTAPNAISDFPEFSSRRVDLPANLPHRQAPATPKPGVIVTGTFGSAAPIHRDGGGALIPRKDAEHYMDVAQNHAPLARAMADHDGHKIAPSDPTAETMVTSKPKGLVEAGNLPIWNRPEVKNDDGTHSSEYSVSFQDEKGREVLVPTVVGGKFLTADGKKPPEGSPAEKAMFQEAWKHYQKTGEHLGKFDKPENADAYAEQLHSRGKKQ